MIGIDATDGSDPLIRLDRIGSDGLGTEWLSTVKHGARLASNRLAIRVFSKWSVKESSDTSSMSPRDSNSDSATPDHWHHYRHYGAPFFWASCAAACRVFCVVYRLVAHFIVLHCPAEWLWHRNGSGQYTEVDGGMGWYYLSLANYFAGQPHTHTHRHILSFLLRFARCQCTLCSPVGKAFQVLSLLPDIS